MKYIENIQKNLRHSQFSDEFAGDGDGNYLLHLTRLIDRTTDLYNFSPVVPIAKKNIHRDRKIKIHSVSKEIRVLKKDYSENDWATIIEGAKNISNSGKDRDDSGKEINEYFDSHQAELGWRKPTGNEYKLTEPFLGYSNQSWKGNIIKIIDGIFAEKTKHDVHRHFVLFPEFSFPPIEDKIDRNEFIKNIRHSYTLQNSDQIDQARDFLFLGSYHDSEQNHNVGVCLPFGLTPLDARSRQGYQHHGNDGVYFQRKRHASKKLGEHLAPVSTLDFPVFVTDVGRVAVLICSDIYDLSLFLGLVRYNLRCLPGGEIDYVLVPAFNRSRKLVETCRQLSFLMNNVVVYVSSFPFADDVRKPYSNKFHCYICGRDANDLGSTSLDEELLAAIVTAKERDFGVDARTKVMQYTISPEKIGLLRLLTRKNFSRAIRQGSRRTHYIGSF